MGVDEDDESFDKNDRCWADGRFDEDDCGGADGSVDEQGWIWTEFVIEDVWLWIEDICVCLSVNAASTPLCVKFSS